MNLEAEKPHDLLSVSWVPRKARLGASESESDGVDSGPSLKA